MDKERKKVIYVEDEPDLIELCRISFNFSGFELEGVLNGEEAMAVVNKIKNKEIQAPDAFILDILLPKISGIEVLKEIRKNKELDGVTIVVFTNYSNEEYKNETRKHKNTKYVLKTDIIPTQLADMIEKMIEKSKNIFRDAQSIT